MSVEIINSNGDNKYTNHNLLGFNNMLFAITTNAFKILNRCAQNQIAKQISHFLLVKGRLHISNATT